MESININDFRIEIYAICIVLAGFIIGLVVRLILVRLADQISQRSEGLIKSLDPTIRRAGPIFLWTIVFVAVAYAFILLNNEKDYGILGDLKARIPGILLGAIVVLVGHLIGVAVRDLVRRTISETRLASTLGTLGYCSVLFIGFIVGLQQIDVNIDVLGYAIIVVIGIILATVGITIAIGSRFHVANLIGRQDLTGVDIGDRVQIDGLEGTVIEIRRTKVHLMTGDGVAYIPTVRFSQKSFVILSPDN